MAMNRVAWSWVGTGSKDVFKIITYCPICGDENVVNVNRKELNVLIKDEGHIQDILPNHSREDREKLVTGYCDECQKKIFRNPFDEKENEDG